MPGYKQINKFILCGLQHFIAHSSNGSIWHMQALTTQMAMFSIKWRNDNYSKHRDITLYVYVQKQLLVSINGKNCE